MGRRVRSIWGGLGYIKVSNIYPVKTMRRVVSCKLLTEVTPQAAASRTGEMASLMNSRLCCRATGAYQQESRISTPSVMLGNKLGSLNINQFKYSN